MKNEDKQLLLKDLCARLPYGVVCKDNNINVIGTLSQIGLHYDMCTLDKDKGDSESCYIPNCKPYLFPLSSMTEEQKIECFEGTDIELDENFEIWSKIASDTCTIITSMSDWLEVINWLNKNHFDYRGLIPMGLAIDATGLNIY